MRAVYNTPHEAFCIALFLTYSWICEVHRSSKPKRTKTPFIIYMSAQPLPIGTFGMGIFTLFFLLKSLCYLWLFVSLQRQSSPSLLTMLKSCEAFFVYTHLNMANLIPFTKRFESSENLVNCLNHKVCRFVTETKPYSTLTILVITDCLLICILCWRCPKQHICIRKVQHSKKVMMLYRFDKKLRTTHVQWNRKDWNCFQMCDDANNSRYDRQSFLANWLFLFLG